MYRCINIKVEIIDDTAKKNTRECQFFSQLFHSLIPEIPVINSRIFKWLILSLLPHTICLHLVTDANVLHN